ncbi:hypothetical protein D9758_017274 [Tetrapyrgos nigripes]|uniref:Uncharacterized protein n=1 Tax=Tetrapyrgos nigripes TaxID=182062 RepID=A0A8H5C2W8_9AGAR|nr:hypothetical protein D9758_017274 [Tetrapyrgos nigripes]
MSYSFDSMNPPPRSEGIPRSTWMGLYITTLHHATLVSAEKLVNSFREYVWGEECLYQPEFSFSFLLEFRGVVWGFCEGWGRSGFRWGGGQASGVKVAKEGKRRVKGRLGSRAEDASIMLHSFGSGSSVDYGDDTAGADVGSNIVDSWIGEKNRGKLKTRCEMNNISNGNWTIASYGAYLQELNICMHIKLCDFGVNGELVFIYTNTFAGTSVYTRGFTAVASGLYR